MARVDRVSLSLPADLGKQVRAAAREDRAALSAWFAEAAETKLLLRNARLAIAAYEAEHGVISEAELDQVGAAWPG